MTWLDWIYWSLAGVLAVAGVWALWRGLLADRARGRERCPKCWYDMSASPGDAPTCPECGRIAKRRAQLQRTRRRYALAGFGLVLLLAASVTAWMPQVRRYGWYGSIPTWVLIAFLPDPAAWCDEMVLSIPGRGPINWYFELDKRELSEGEEAWLFNRIKSGYEARGELWDGVRGGAVRRVQVFRVPMGSREWYSRWNRSPMRVIHRNVEVSEAVRDLLGLHGQGVDSSQWCHHWVLRARECDLVQANELLRAVADPGPAMWAIAGVLIIDAREFIAEPPEDLPRADNHDPLLLPLSDMFPFRPPDRLAIDAPAIRWNNKVVVMKGTDQGVAQHIVFILHTMRRGAGDWSRGDVAMWHIADALSVVARSMTPAEDARQHAATRIQNQLFESGVLDIGIGEIYVAGDWRIFRGTPDDIAIADYLVRNLRREVAAANGWPKHWDDE